MGGNHQHSNFNYIHELNLKKKTIISKYMLKSKLNKFNMMVVNSDIYILGGSKTNQMFYRMEKIDLKKMTSKFIYCMNN